MTEYKTIKIKHRKRLEHFLPLWEDMQQIGHVHVLGGFARWLASPLKDAPKPGDVDIYCEDQRAFERMDRHLRAQGCSRKYDTDRSFTYYNAKRYNRLPTIQLIKPQINKIVVSTGSPQEMIDSFDLVISKVAVLSPEECLVHPDFTAHEKRKMLVFSDRSNPVRSVLRAMKYAAKGYSLPQEEASKLLDRWNDTEEKERKETRELAKKERLVTTS